MCRLQTVFEIGKRFDKRPRALARGGIDRMPRTQVADESREQAFDGAHRLKREVRDIVTDAAREAAHLLPRERGEIDAAQDECGALDATVEARARRRAQNVR